MKQRLASYFDVLHGLPGLTRVTGADGSPIALHDAFARAVGLVDAVRADGHKLMFVGNGGSAGIASHAAIDYAKNGGVAALCFNDGASLTCFGNDLGFENVFAPQIALHGRPGDVLFAISSSGRSPDILRAVETARTRRCHVLTFSGFDPDNPLRRTGDMNFHVGNDRYGFVEIFHLTLIHAILDLDMGWLSPAVPEMAMAAPAQADCPSA